MIKAWNWRSLGFSLIIIAIASGPGPLKANDKKTTRTTIPTTVMSDAVARKTEMELVKEIHKTITATTMGKTEAEMKPYTVDLPSLAKGSNPPTTFSMVPIKGGIFQMGSPVSEPDRNGDESPRHTVTVHPFWMQKCEVTWDEYEPYMYQDYRREPEWKTNSVADAIAYPSKPYVEMSFGMGKDRYPAVSMTQHAANKYCQWLSARTGHFYRLPTEAEWEYACRAGTQTAYSFGDDPGELDKYAWWADNSMQKYQKVGKKLPNPWGLHDMHGNVAEWCLDQYVPYSASETNNPWIKLKKTYPVVVRGGSWEDPAEMCRSASRLGSKPLWNEDNQLPKSSWHLTFPNVGFRVVRPLKVPTVEEMFKYWNNEVEVDMSSFFVKPADQPK